MNQYLSQLRNAHITRKTSLRITELSVLKENISKVLTGVSFILNCTCCKGTTKQGISISTITEIQLIRNLLSGVCYFGKKNLR